MQNLSFLLAKVLKADWAIYCFWFRRLNIFCYFQTFNQITWLHVFGGSCQRVTCSRELKLFRFMWRLRPPNTIKSLVRLEESKQLPCRNNPARKSLEIMNYNKHKNFSFFILFLLCSYRQLSLKINVFGTVSENNAPYMSGQFVC